MSGRTRTPGAAKALLEKKPQAEPRRVNIRKRMPRGDPDKGAAGNQKRADELAAALAPTIADLRGQGHTSVRKLVDALNASRVPTDREGGRWHVTSVQRLLGRIEALALA